MKKYSIWSEEIKCTEKKLDKDIIVDVLIIGGGMTGVNTLYHLLNSNLKVCLVEKNIIGSGVTSRTTGKLTYLQQNIYSKLKTYHNENISKLYLESQKYACGLAKSIIEKEKINCNFDKVKSYLINNNSKKYNKEKKLLNEFGVDLKLDNILNEETCYIEDSYVIHPLKYLNHLISVCSNNKNVSIYENTSVLKIKKENNYYLCDTNTNYSIKSKYIVLAMHYPYFLFPYLFPLKCTLEKSYISAKEIDKVKNLSSITITNPTVSTRYHKDENNYKITLINSHNLCIKDNNKEQFNLLKSDNPNYLWSNKDIITNDYLPFIGSLNKENTLLIGTGYNTWGMTNGILAGKILSDIIMRKENKYIKLFNPKRCLNVGKLLRFPIILTSNMYSFLKTKISKNKKWYKNNVRFEKRNGKNIAIYKDENNKEHIVYNLCPHLKCSLIFNEVEHTWDCPCHGSRFDIDGKSIEGPSNYNITYKD